jgi:hypothetical protein
MISLGAFGRRRWCSCACRSGGSGSSACSIQTALTPCNNWPEEEPGGDGAVVARRKVDAFLLELFKNILQKPLSHPVFLVSIFSTTVNN